MLKVTVWFVRRLADLTFSIRRLAKINFCDTSCRHGQVLPCINIHGEVVLLLTELSLLAVREFVLLRGNGNRTLTLDDKLNTLILYIYYFMFAYIYFFSGENS